MVCSLPVLSGWTVVKFVALTTVLRAAQGEIHTLDLENDGRSAFSISTFAFSEGGEISLHVHNYSLYLDDKLVDDVEWGIVLRPVRSKADGPSKLALEAEGIVQECFLQHAVQETPELVLLLSNPEEAVVKRRRNLHWGAGDDHDHAKNHMDLVHTFNGTGVGRYDIEMIVCLPSDQKNAELELTAIFTTICYNIGASGAPNYLSAGETGLPVLYGMLAALFAFTVGVWCYVLIRRAANVLTLHYMMLTLLMFKMTSLIAYAIHLGFVARLGQTLSVIGWDVVYFLFSFLDGGAMFVIILLVGSGWSYIKPRLNGRDNNMLTAVVVLQVVSNVARVFVGESSPGSAGFVRWGDILAVVDIVCCALVLFPLIWSIHKLKTNLAAVKEESKGVASKLDPESGKPMSSNATKAKDNTADANASDDGGTVGVDMNAASDLAHSLKKLKQFRHFYILVVCYIYFTRIVVYLADSAVRFNVWWVSRDKCT